MAIEGPECVPFGVDWNKAQLHSLKSRYLVPKASTILLIKTGWTMYTISSISKPQSSQLL